MGQSANLTQVKECEHRQGHTAVQVSGSFLSSKGPIIGHYGLEANAMVVAEEELGLEYKDISIDLDYKEIYRPFGGRSDGTTASSWAVKECANKLKKQILEASIEEANNPPAPGGFGMFGGSAPKQPPNPLKGLKPADLDMQDGESYCQGRPQQGRSFGPGCSGESVRDLLRQTSGIPLDQAG